MTSPPSPPPPPPAAAAIAAEILRQTAACGRARSVSPIAIARALDPAETWRRLLGPVRLAALALQGEGRVEILRKGRPVAGPEEARGVIRLRIAEGGGDGSGGGA